MVFRELSGTPSGGATAVDQLVHRGLGRLAIDHVPAEGTVQILPRARRSARGRAGSPAGSAARLAVVGPDEPAARGRGRQACRAVGLGELPARVGRRKSLSRCMSLPRARGWTSSPSSRIPRPRAGPGTTPLEGIVRIEQVDAGPPGIAPVLAGRGLDGGAGRGPPEWATPRRLRPRHRRHRPQANHRGASEQHGQRSTLGPGRCAPEGHDGGQVPRALGRAAWRRTPLRR